MTLLQVLVITPYILMLGIIFWIDSLKKELYTVKRLILSLRTHTDNIYQETIDHTPSPAIFVYTLPNILIGEICIRNGFKGEGVFFIQEKFDKEFIFGCAEDHLKKSRSAVCLAGWVDIDMEGVYLADLYLLK